MGAWSYDSDANDGSMDIVGMIKNGKKLNSLKININPTPDNSRNVGAMIYGIKNKIPISKSNKKKLIKYLTNEKYQLENGKNSGWISPKKRIMSIKKELRLLKKQ